MEFYQREFLIYRITSGYVKYKINEDLSIFIYNPDCNTKYLAQEKYVEAYELAKECEVLTDDDIIKLMLELELWSNFKQNLLDEVIPNKIEELKVDIYNSNLDTPRREILRSELRKTEHIASELISQRHQFDYVTCHGVATYYRLNHIINSCTKYSDNKPYDWSDVDIHTVTGFVNNQTILEKEFRELARTEPWHSIWSTSKKNGVLFGKAGIDLNDDQRRLISYSSFYDQIYEHHECPHESILDDDDMLDGWLILQKREREKNQNKKAIDKKLSNPKIANAQEIFIPVNTVEDARKVEEINDKAAKRVKNQRLSMMKDKEVVDTDFADIKQDITMAANQLYLDKIKGR